MARKELLTDEQRRSLLDISRLTEFEMMLYYDLSEKDINIINLHRRDENKLGFAIQLCLLRFPGCTLQNIVNVPLNIIKFIANQINANEKAFNLYSMRDTTKREHLIEIRKVYGYKNLNKQEYINITENLSKYAFENNSSIFLIQKAIELLRAEKIILPVLSMLEKLVSEVKSETETRIYMLLTENLSNEEEISLNKIINPSANSKNTPLSWLREAPSRASSDSFIKVIKKIEYIKALNLNIDTSKIHANRFLQLARVSSRYEPYAFRRFEKNKRYALLLIHLISLFQELTDYAIEIHDRQMTSLFLKGKKSQEEIQKNNGKSINKKITEYVDIATALIKAKESQTDPFKEIEKIMSWPDIIKSVEEAKNLSRPKNFDYIDLIKPKYTYMRRYTPLLLKTFVFHSTQSFSNLLKAMEILNDLNLSGNRQFPINTPLSFISKRWLKYVINEQGKVDRRYYEIAVLMELRNGIRSGDIWIEGSRMHKNFDEYLIPEEEWNNTKIYDDSKKEIDIYNFIDEKTNALDTMINYLSKNIDVIKNVELNKNRIQIKRFQANTPSEAKEFTDSLYKRLPRIDLTDLLIEVSKWTGFLRSFVHASSGKYPKKSEKEVIIATLMALGTNMGLTKMAEATPEISYHQLANISGWRMYEDAMNHAQAVLVNYHHKLSLSAFWGDGTTSSSDGMRVPVGVSSLHADSNPHYGTGKGTTIYRFTSDQFNSFYSKIINTNSRDAVHVIDGLLHHETDLIIEEHYTDTAGYTDQIFGLSSLLGLRFAPRLRDVGNAVLYSINPISESSNLKSVIKGRINTKLIFDNFEDILRIVYSIKKGKCSATLIMKKLNSYSRQSKVALALSELGKIEKTIFLLDYFTDENLRRKINRGLNKSEAMNALARAIFFAKRGEFREHGMQEQLQRASALNIIINAISIWNTVYLAEAISQEQIKNPINTDLLAHISPLGWEHINFFGEYNFDFSQAPNNLRPLL